ncbi:MAG: hypothetical protein V3U72_03275 [Candidatus Aenigmarchaeota archaeon]
MDDSGPPYTSWKALRGNYTFDQSKKYNINYRNQDGSFLIPDATIFSANLNCVSISHRKLLKAIVKVINPGPFREKTETEYKKVKTHIFPKKMKVHKSNIESIQITGKESKTIYRF